MLSFRRFLFATGPRQRPRRPSTPAVPDAGLLAADPLQPRPAAWAAVRERPLCDRDLIRPTRGVPMRHRIAVFLLFVVLLVAVPVLAGRL